MQQSNMQTPKKSMKSFVSNDSNSKVSKRPQSSNSSSQKKIGSAANSNSKKKTDTQIYAQKLQNSNNKCMKYTQEITMINTSISKLNQLQQNQSNLLGSQTKPIKATLMYGLKINGFEDRSRQNASNCLNQSLSQNHAQDSNNQIKLLDEQIVFPNTMREDKEETDNDEPMNLITYKNSTNYKFNENSSNPYEEENKVNLNINDSNYSSLIRRFSNSTERVEHSVKENGNDISNGSISMKQRRSRTLRRQMRDIGQSEQDNMSIIENNETIQQDQKNNNVVQIQIRESELTNKNDNYKEINIINIEEANTVDEFAKSILFQSFTKTPNSTKSSTNQNVQNKQNKSTVEKNLDIYQPKAGNIQDNQQTQNQPTSKKENTQDHPYSPQNNNENKQNIKTQLYSTDESLIDNQINNKDQYNQLISPKVQEFQGNGKVQQQNNLNEDINMQLYGQISMFDQLTDYIENDEEQYSNRGEDDEEDNKNEPHCHGEDSFGDNGEDDDSNDLREYRQRINVLNEDISNFIMDHGEDGEGISSTNMLNPVHNLHVQTECNQIFDEPIHQHSHQKEVQQEKQDISQIVEQQDYENEEQLQSNDSQEQFECDIMIPMNQQENVIFPSENSMVNQLNQQIQKLMSQVNILQTDLQTQTQQMNEYESQITVLNKEKVLLQDLLELKKQNEFYLNEQISQYQQLTKEQEVQIMGYQHRDQEQQEKIEDLMKENQILKMRLAQYLSDQKQSVQQQSISLEDKTNQISSPRSTKQSVMFKKYKQQQNGHQLSSPKILYKQDFQNNQNQNINKFKDKRNSGGIFQKSIDNSSPQQMTGKNLLDKIMQVKGNEKNSSISGKNYNQHYQKEKLNSSLTKITNNTPQKLKSAQKTSKTIKNFTQLSTSGQKYSNYNGALQTPKGTRKLQNFPIDYYQ